MERLLWICSVVSADKWAPLLQWYLDVDRLQFVVKAGAGANRGVDAARGAMDHPGVVRFRPCGSLRPGAWHHLVLSHGRGKKIMGLGGADSLSLFVDGLALGAESVPHVDFPGFSPDGPKHSGVALLLGAPSPSGADAPDVAPSVAPVWHLGPLLLADEPLGAAAAAAMSLRGPHYTGAFAGEEPAQRTRAAEAAALRALHARLAGGAHEEGLEQHLSARGLDCTARGRRALSAEAPEAHEAERSRALGEGLRAGPGREAVVLALSANLCAAGALPPHTRRCGLEGWLGNGAWAPLPPPRGAAEASALPAACVFGGGASIVPGAGLDGAAAELGGLAVLLPLVQAAEDEPAMVGALALVAALARGLQGGLRFLHEERGLEVLAFLLHRKIMAACAGGPDAAGLATSFRAAGGIPAASPLILRALLPLAVSGLEDMAVRSLERGGAARGAAEGVVWEGAAWSFAERGEAPFRRCVVVDPRAVTALLLNHQLWGLGEESLPAHALLLDLLLGLVAPENASANLNAARLVYEADASRWLLHLMAESGLAGRAPRPGGPLLLTTCARLLYALMLRCSAYHAAPDFAPTAGRAAAQRNQRDLNRLCEAVLATLSAEGRAGAAQRRRGLSEGSASSREREGAAAEEEEAAPSAVLRCALLQLLLNVALAHRRALSGDLRPLGPGLERAAGVPERLCLAREDATERAVAARLRAAGGTAFWRDLALVLSPEWFISVLDNAGDATTAALALRLLALLLQLPARGHCLDFGSRFLDAGGFRLLLLAIPKHSAEQAVPLHLLALFVRLPVHELPLRISDGDGAPGVYAREELSALLAGAPGPHLQGMPLFEDIWQVLMHCVVANLNLAGHQRAGPRIAAAAAAANASVVACVSNLAASSAAVRRSLRNPRVAAALAECLFTARENDRATADAPPAEGADGLARRRERAGAALEDAAQEREDLEAFAGGSGAPYAALLAKIVAQALYRGSAEAGELLRTLMAAAPPYASPEELLAYHDAVCAVASLAVRAYLDALAGKHGAARAAAPRSPSSPAPLALQMYYGTGAAAAAAAPAAAGGGAAGAAAWVDASLRVPEGALAPEGRAWSVLCACAGAVRGLAELALHGFMTPAGVLCALRCNLLASRAAARTHVHGLLGAPRASALQAALSAVAQVAAVSLLREMQRGGALAPRQHGAGAAEEPQAGERAPAAARRRRAWRRCCRRRCGSSRSTCRRCSRRPALAAAAAAARARCGGCGRRC